MSEFDYIIVGAGSAGCVLGNTNGPMMALAWRAADLILEDVK